tara:strand:- start:1408 stop:2682 length:1275 start_codon:yes stop_codon:yes gene_type:complete
MRNKNLIKVKNVSKIYPLNSNPLKQLSYYLGVKNHNLKYKKALNNISIFIKSGERVGVIGHNGSGKTTLLRIVGEHTKPTNGIIISDTNIQSLLQSGFGFNKELSGLQNIKNSLIYNGFSPRKNKDKIADIISFVELEDFINYPIKTYSLGMLARLEFAAATALEPSCLIIDEVLGAGDGYFVKKCSNRMHQLIKNTTLLLVSHSLDQIREYCERVIWIDNGLIKKDGSTELVISAYRNHMIKNKDFNFAKKEDMKNKSSFNEIKNNKIQKKVKNLFNTNFNDFGKINFFKIQNLNEIDFVINTGESLSISIELYINFKSTFSLIFLSQEGDWKIEMKSNKLLKKGLNKLNFNIEKLEIGTGEYYLFPALKDNQNNNVYLAKSFFKRLNIPKTNWSGPPIVHFNCEWNSGKTNDKVTSRVSSWA